MSPEYGATCGFFPVDELTLDYLRLTGRPTERVALVEAYCRENLLWHEPDEHPGVLAGRRARPRRGRAVARRAAPAAGPRAARAGEAVVPRGAADLRRRAGRTTTRRSPRRSRRATRRPSRRPAGTHVAQPEQAAVAVAAPPRPGTVRVSARRRGGRARPRRRRDRRDHLVHEHVEPAGDGRGRPARQARGRARPAPRAVGEDLARAGLARRHRLLRARRACRPTSTSSASTRSATAARPASATRARCRPRSRRRSPRATSSPAPCSPGTATSRRGSIPR